MTYFEQALSAPQLHFTQLRQMEPVLVDGKPIVRSTKCAIESEISWNGHRYLLFVPLRRDCLQHIEELEQIALDRSRGPLIHNRILYNELLMTSSLGRSERIDVILQEIPNGVGLTEAARHYKSANLKVAIANMKSRLDAIGFRHNNLRPSNVIICRNGMACPLRYWYGEWVDVASNNISELERLLDAHYDPALEPLKRSLPHSQDEATTPNRRYSEIIRQYRYKRYGFVDSDGVQITPYIYTWASDFCEGRAIVARNGKMGVIDDSGHKVIKVKFKHIEFDISTATFTAIGDNYRYILDYDGKLIAKYPFDE
jgi:hypothetical protein